MADGRGRPGGGRGGGGGGGPPGGGGVNRAGGAVLARDGALRLARPGSRRGLVVLRMLEVLAGAVVLVVGLSLFVGSAQLGGG